MSRCARVVLLLAGVMFLPATATAGTAAKGAEKAGPKCAACRDTGRVPCPIHSRISPRYKAFCSEDVQPACCKGVGWTPCPNCADEAAKQRFEKIATTYAREHMGDGFYPYGGKLVHSACEHFRFKTSASSHLECHEYEAAAEKAFSLFQRVFGEEGVDQLAWPEKAHFLILASRDEYHQFLDWYKANRNVNPQEIDFLKQGDSSRLITERLQVLVRPISGGGKDDKDLLLHRIAHGAGHLAIEKYRTHGHTPDWLGEGFAGRSEIEALQSPRVYCIQYVAGGAGQHPPHEWRQTVREALLKRAIPTFAQMFEKKVGEMNIVDWSMTISVVSWLTEAYPKRTVRLVSALHEGKESKEAFEAVFERPVADVEKEWQKWARTH